MAAQLMATKGPSLREAGRVDAPGDELLARAGLAVNEDGRVARRDARDGLVDPPHGRARADEARRLRLRRHRAAEAFELDAQLAVLDGAGDREREELRVDRLGDEVVGAGAHGGDGRLHAALPGDHDDGERGVDAGDALAHLDAAHLGHAEVGQDRVELLGRDELERLGGRRARDDARTLALERHAHEVAHFLLVVDHDDAGFHRASNKGMCAPSP